MLLRLFALLGFIFLGAGLASADEGGGPPAPIELQWLKLAGEVISTVGMPGVIGGLLYLLKLQKADHEAERAATAKELAEERAYIKTIQAERIDSASASADRLATVAVSGSAAIAANTTAMAELVAIARSTKELVSPLQGEHNRILSNQEGLSAKLADISGRVGPGCKA